MGFGKRAKFATGDEDPTDPGDGEAQQRTASEWIAWRRAAQKVARAWNEWSAADGRDRAGRYERYASAIAAEERAAAQLRDAIGHGAQSHAERGEEHAVTSPAVGGVADGRHGS